MYLSSVCSVEEYGRNEELPWVVEETLLDEAEGRSRRAPSYPATHTHTLTADGRAREIGALPSRHHYRLNFEVENH